MHQVIETLLGEQPILLDGAWGTCFQEQGLPVGDCPDAWNLNRPDVVRGIAKAYVDAGSRIILTNTFGSSPLMLANHALADKTAEINRAGARLSKEVAGEQTLVFASIGPSGSVVMMQEHTEEEFFDAFLRQAEALAEGGADGLVLETFNDLTEAEIAVRAAVETGLPVVSSMVYDNRGRGEFTMMGQTPEQCAEVLLAAGADLIGSNCGQGIESFANLCQRLHQAANRPVWAKPNAGMPEIIEGKTKFVQTPQEFISYAPELLESGVGFIGGCCGTTPQFISELKHSLISS